MQGRTVDIARLYSTEQGRLKRMIGRFVGSRATSEDLVHQAFLKLMTVAEISEIENWPAYLTSMVRNLARNHVRDQGRRGEIDAPQSVVDSVRDPAPSPEMACIHRAELRRVLAAIAALPQRRRQAFVLCKFQGLTYDEIATRMRISRNTVITHIVIALTQLDRQFGET